ncbi:MAG: RDD family protein [Oscillospiraceae bacterium]|nr:RDD family protein [Oscillospiraceae bacterium]
MSTYEQEVTARLWHLPEVERKERLCLPWRRLIARIVDMVFYTLLWWPIVYLAFHWNMLLMNWAAFGASLLVFSLALMILLEPIFLAFLGTTPGKRLFGIRLRTEHGGKLSILQGYRRIFRVLTHGCGFVVIPIYNFVRMYKACKRCQIEGSVEWDEGIEYTSSGEFPIQAFLGVICVAVSIFIFGAVYFAADMPRHRGQVTVARFEENLDAYWRFHGSAWNTALYFHVGLIFYDTPIGHIFDRMDPPEVVFQEADGIVTGISFRLVDETRLSLASLPEWLRAFAVSYVGAQRNMSFTRMHMRGGVLDSLLAPLYEIGNREGSGRASFIAAGVEVNFDISVGHRVNAYFSMRKI